MVDMSHIAGLVAAGVHSSPFDHADIVTTTTHKTLRGPRNALVFVRKEYAELFDKTIIPGFQGGPHNNNIAAVAIALKEAKTANFKKYAKQVVKNAKAFAKVLIDNECYVTTGGTDNHLLVINTVKSFGKTGAEVEKILEANNIIVNKNTVPFEPRTPFDPSGIRIGTPCVTTQGYDEADIKKLALRIVKLLR
jgi:glycine hydroxymethyltransferase